jgi:hypothetical protein
MEGLFNPAIENQLRFSESSVGDFRGERKAGIYVTWVGKFDPRVLGID